MKNRYTKDLLAKTVIRAKSGDNDAFTELYNATYKSKFYVALRYTGNEDDAADVLQDAYIKAYNSLDKLQDPDKFDSWLGMIVANTAKNELRRNKPVLFSDMDSENEDGEELAFEDLLVDEHTDFNPEEKYTREETVELVHELLDELPAEQRMCMIMFYLEDCSIEEIAETLNCNKNTVTSRLNYGRKKITARGKELEKKGYKLYGISPVALLVLLLKNEMGAAMADGSVLGASAAGPVKTALEAAYKASSTAGKAATGITTSATGEAAIAAATVAKGTAAKATIGIGKIIAGIVISAGLITGGVLLALNGGSKNKDNKPETVAENTSETEASEVSSTDETVNPKATSTPTPEPTATPTPEPTATPTSEPINEEDYYMDMPLHLTDEGEETGFNVYFKKVPGFEFYPDQRENIMNFDADGYFTGSTETTSAGIYDQNNEIRLYNKSGEESYYMWISLVKADEAAIEEINNHKNNWGVDDYTFAGSSIGGGAYLLGQTKDGQNIYHINFDKGDPTVVRVNDDYVLFIFGTYTYDGTLRDSVYDFYKTTNAPYLIAE